MSVFFERFDSVPLQNDDFSFEFDSWSSNMVDTYNNNVNIIQNRFTSDFGPEEYTTAQITVMGPDARDGILWYCTDAVPPCYVGKVNGSLVKFTTTSFP